jgi:predicted ATPase
VTEDYRARARAQAASRDRERQLSARIAHLRLATFLAGAAWVVWTLSHHATPTAFAVAAVLFTSFGALVVWHARVEDRAEWFDALRQTNDWASARVDRRWEDLPAGDPPAGADLSHHPYAIDLDVFGRASLFQWLGPLATPAGSGRLASWLLAPAPGDEIRARQAAAIELATLREWREALAAHGVLARGARQPEVDRFLAWAEGAPHHRLPHLQAIVFLLTGAIWALLLAFATGLVDAALWLLPLLAGIVLSFATAGRVQSAFDRAGAGQRALSRYAALFEHLGAPRFEAVRLRDLQERLSAGGVAAPGCMRRLNRILGFADLRSGAALLHFPIQALTLWDFHVLFALERWRRVTGPRIRGWFDALADVDALAALATVRHDNADWCQPEIEAAPVYLARRLGHPLIVPDRRVSNDVEVGPPGTVLLVTGSNMSGKSTLLRAIGLNAVLAQAGAPACATALRLPPADLQTSIRVTDSLELGLSYFMAALARLKGVVDAAERPRPGRVLLYLLDEILQGTNSAEREIAVLAVTRHLLEAGAIGAMTTHDLNLAAREPLRSAARLVHFAETVDEQGQMSFDYRLREGIATSRNALRLMKLIGIDL